MEGVEGVTDDGNASIFELGDEGHYCLGETLVYHLSEEGDIINGTHICDHLRDLRVDSVR